MKKKVKIFKACHQTDPNQECFESESESDHQGDTGSIFHNEVQKYKTSDSALKSFYFFLC